MTCRTFLPSLPERPWRFRDRCITFLSATQRRATIEHVNNAFEPVGEGPIFY
jgi:hypothetical protein